MLPVLSTHVFLKQRLHPGLLELAGRSGEEGIELFAARQHFDYTSREHVLEIAGWFASNPLQPFSMHAPLFPDTKGMINARTLAMMKSSAFLINTSRGPLVVDQDLADALNSGRIAGAGVDVLSIEPPPAGNPLLTARNCLVTPHIAWATKEARARLMQSAVENLTAFLAGQPKNVIA